MIICIDLNDNIKISIHISPKTRNSFCCKQRSNVYCIQEIAKLCGICLINTALKDKKCIDSK